MRPFTMTISTDDFALSNLLPHRLHTLLKCRMADTKFLLPANVVKIHHVRRVSFMAVQTRLSLSICYEFLHSSDSILHPFTVACRIRFSPLLAIDPLPFDLLTFGRTESLSSRVSAVFRKGERFLTSLSGASIFGIENQSKRRQQLGILRPKRVVEQ